MPGFVIIAATRFEIQPLIQHFDIAVTAEEGLFKNTLPGPEISVLITGVGMVNTAFMAGRHLQKNDNYFINAGICGAINREIKIGQVVNVVTDTISEMGAENDSEFIKYADLNLGGECSFMSQGKMDYAPFNDLKKVKGITVNTVHGNEESIQKLISRFNPDTESMEGAAFFRACHHAAANYFQVRAVSNYVEKRDKSKWNIPLAIYNLNEFLITMIQELDHKEIVKTTS